MTRRVCAALALAAYLVTVLGLPLPGSAAKDASRPFPCLHHACGCTCAEDCWGHCCCFSVAERLAWAREHGVGPPAEALEQTNEGSSPCPACALRTGCTGNNRNEPPPPRSASWAVGVSALRCHGLGTLWTSTDAVLPPPASFAWRPAEPPPSRHPTPQPFPRRLADVPPTPPPRSATA